MKDVLFPIVPICEKQLLNIREEDLVFVNGVPLARTCRIDSAGGGYDQFRDIFLARFGFDTGPDHFITQLYGCTHECPWCYITIDGIWGDAVQLKASDIVNLVHSVNEKRKAAGSVYDARTDTMQEQPLIQVLHLMGGAPALYLNSWPALYHKILKADLVFHGDFLLDEGLYNIHVLKCLVGMCKEYQELCSIYYDIPFKSGQLHSVSLKPGAPLSRLQLANLKALHASGLPFYIAFTGMQEEEIQVRKEQVIAAGITEEVFNDSFSINPKHYKSLG